MTPQGSAPERLAKCEIPGAADRANVQTYAGVLDKSVIAAGTRDPLLAARLAGERKRVERLSAGLAKRLFKLRCLMVLPMGLAELSRVVSNTQPGNAANA